MREFCIIHKVPLQIIGNKWRCLKCEDDDTAILAQALANRNSTALMIYPGTKIKIGGK